MKNIETRSSFEARKRAENQKPEGLTFGQIVLFLAFLFVSLCGVIAAFRVWPRIS